MPATGARACCGLTRHYGAAGEHRAMDDGHAPLQRPELPTTIVRPDRRARSIDPWRARAAGLVLVAHAIGLVAVDRALDLRLPGRTTAAPAETTVEIRFLPPDPVPPLASIEPPPVDNTPAPARPPARNARPQPPTAPPPQREDGLAAQFLPATPEPSIETRRLFDPNGTVRLPEGFVDRSAPPPRDPMAPPSSPIPVDRTRFDAAWKPDGESLVEEISREVPLLGLILGAGRVPDCPPNSTDVRCEATAQEQRARIPPPPQSGKQPW